MKRENKLKIKVLLVDDHPLVREGVRSSLLKHDRFEIVGEASSGPEAINKAKKSAPDVVVMDFTMPGMSGLEATMCLRDACPDTKVLILTEQYSELKQWRRFAEKLLALPRISSGT